MTELISRDDLAALIEAEQVTVVDALPSTYYDQQHLPGAVNLTHDEVGTRAPGLLPHLDATIVTYCSNAACGNSRAVADRLASLGYTHVLTYRDGIQDWVAAGYPTESTVRG
jgi:rhodanese-related sulfurtransferase